ncbi:hypothetical protein GRZ55_20785 [Chelativorans sp. ZYF759]|uniref:MaoC family dehydratase n=1 Tax=Chelativorans sp. ZYF759 TaxID=2692213 RepID=UPI00145F040E|nr:MaoC family dehydratase [Chelativorans sp. ZYF759]NMG41679.1 hypothetical protein [Chelativorans sp. ZYF759]
MAIEPGMSLPPLKVDFVSPETMKAWAPILEDPNPIHLDREVVRAKGLGDRLINQGPINLSYIINMLQAALPGGFIESISNRFVDNVYEGDALEAGATVTTVARSGDTVRVACDFTLKAEERDIVITGTAVVELPAAVFDALG